jgi:hypothetical protein
MAEFYPMAGQIRNLYSLRGTSKGYPIAADCGIVDTYAGT